MQQTLNSTLHPGKDNLPHLPTFQCCKVKQLGVDSFFQFRKFEINSIPFTPLDALSPLQALQLKEQRVHIRAILQILLVLLITTTALLAFAKRKEIAAAWTWNFFYSLLVILNMVPEKIRRRLLKYTDYKNPKSPVWAFQTRKVNR